MRRAVKNIASVLTAAVLAGTMAGCSFREVESETDFKRIGFSWWGNVERNEATLAGIKQFSEETGITVKPRYGEFNGFKALMDANLYSGNAADVMQLNYDWVYQYSPDGEGLYDLYELADIIDLKAFPEGSLDSMLINGKLQGVPTALNAVNFVYNKDVYDSYGLELPSTWDDLFRAAEVMSADGVYPTSMSEKHIWLCAVAYAEQVTGEKVFDGAQVLVTSEQMELMLDFYVRLINEGVTQLGEDFNRMDFADGKVAGVTAWATDTDYYDGEAEENGINIRLGQYLSNGKAKGFGWYMKPSSVYSIRKDSGDPESAAMLLNYLANDGGFATLSGTTRGVPVSRSAQEALEAHGLLTGIDVEATKKMLDEPRLGAMSPYLENQDIVSCFIDSGESVRYGRSGTKEAADNAVLNMKRVVQGTMSK